MQRVGVKIPGSYDLHMDMDRTIRVILHGRARAGGAGERRAFRYLCALHAAHDGGALGLCRLVKNPMQFRTAAQPLAAREM